MKLSTNIKLKKIDLKKSDGCKHSDISGRKNYMVNYNGTILFGKFNKEWYGWNFTWFGSAYCGLQLDSLKEVWEVI